MSDETRTTVDILRAARDRIADPSHFFRGQPTTHAWNSRGHDCEATDADAVRWTSWGAVALASNGATPADVRGLLNRAADETELAVRCHNHLCCQPHEEALAVFDHAIARASRPAGGAGGG